MQSILDTPYPSFHSFHISHIQWNIWYSMVLQSHATLFTFTEGKSWDKNLSIFVFKVERQNLFGTPRLYSWDKSSPLDQYMNGYKDRNYLCYCFLRPAPWNCDAETPILPVMKHFRSSLQAQWQLEWISLDKKLDTFMQLSLRTSSQTPPVFFSAWEARYFHIIWNHWLLLKIHYVLRVVGISLSE